MHCLDEDSFVVSWMSSGAGGFNKDTTPAGGVSSPGNLYHSAPADEGIKDGAKDGAFANTAPAEDDT
jgi:hypothetical protein